MSNLSVDRRRRLGPSTAIPLKFAPLEANNDNELNNEDKQSDKLFIQLSNIPTASGSSFIQSSSTLILSSVYGPRPSFKKTFNSNAIVKINFSKSNFLIDDSNKIIESVILSTLETSILNLINLKEYPKSTIDIFVNLINYDNSISFLQLLKLIHNSVNLAIIDSGISIINFPTAGISNNTFVNCIHSDNYNSNNQLDIKNESLLSLYISNKETATETDNIKDFQNDLNNAINDAKSLRTELSQFCFNKL